MSSNGRRRLSGVAGVDHSDAWTRAPVTVIPQSARRPGDRRAYGGVLGEHQVVTNDLHDRWTGLHRGVYFAPIDDIPDGAWHFPDLGWAPPAYSTPRFTGTGVVASIL